MYTEQDNIEINRRLRRSIAGTVCAAVAVLAVYIIALTRRIEWLVYLSGTLLFAVAAFGIIDRIIPNARYLQFLRDMERGGSHDMIGSIVSIVPETEIQDGVRVHHVHLFLTEEQDERIVYLNDSKAEGFPAPGTNVRLRCFGRHIIECAVNKI